MSNLPMKRNPLRAMIACGFLLCGTTMTCAHAQDTLLLSGGEVADAAYYSYVGAIVPFGSHDGSHRWFQRYWLDAFGYEYDGAPGRVQADACGVEAALGYGGSNAAGWWNASLGLRYTDTRLSPDDRSASGRGSQLGGKLQLEAEGQIAPAWRLGGIASYSNEQNGYWVRARLLHGASPTRAFGFEALANGNDEADATAVGLVTTLQPAQGSRWSIGLKAGYRFQDNADGPYGGVEVGYAF
jgi:hypothetical protein